MQNLTFITFMVSEKIAMLKVFVLPFEMQRYELIRDSGSTKFALQGNALNSDVYSI